MTGLHFNEELKPVDFAGGRWILWAFSVLVLSLSNGVVFARPAAPLDDHMSSKALHTSRQHSPVLFRQLTPKQTGIEFINYLAEENIQHYVYNGSGVTVGDYDGDGRPDIYLVSLDGSNRLYRQTDPFRFEDVTEKAGVSGGDAWGTGSSFVDIDNDGDLDLYVCNLGAPNLLYLNQGNGQFVESAKKFGLDHMGASVMSAFADYDNDGDLDLYLVTNRVFSTAKEARNAKVRMVDGKATVHPDFLDQYMIIDGHFAEAGQKDVLFRNDGDGRFTDVSDQAGIDGYDMGLSATWWDYDNDGWLDLYVGNDLQTPDHLYRNNGDGTFLDVLPGTVGHTPWFSMGADFGDINNDGLFDYVIADMSATTHEKQKVNMGDMANAGWFLERGEPRQYMRNALYLGTGTHRFMEVAFLAGIDSTDWTWSVKFGDLDNDGWQDLFFANGLIRDSNNSDYGNTYRKLQKEKRYEEAERFLRQLPPLLEANLAFRNKGDLSFEDLSDQWGLDLTGVSQGAAYADFDRDGYLDLVVNNMDQPVAVYRNMGSGKQAVLIELQGEKSNRFGVGARVKVTTEAGEQVRQLSLARGYMSTDEPVLHFGLGDETKIKQLQIEWPSGVRQVFNDLSAGTIYTVKEAASGEQAPATQRKPLFTDHAVSSGLDFVHREKPFDDFKRQPLLPNKLSQLGPGLAWGDANGDGVEDLFIGGAAGQPGALYINDGKGHFNKSFTGPWNKDAAAEDMGAVWLDADMDGDMDLYVVSGGVECEPGESVLRDRLYLNEGRGMFVRARGDYLPDSADSGSSVVAADFDRDGDLDLFVGGRVVPGKYPVTPNSRLLRNDLGSFVDVTAELAPGLGSAGMVTGALWSDADGDGWPDLLLALEWGPVKLFHNDQGKLVDSTEQAGLSSYSGWWNGITGVDVDADGDMDYIASNFGLNTKYSASNEHPAQLYVRDFDANGRPDLVEAGFDHGTLYPVRGKSCSTAAMPRLLSEKYTTFSAFAKATLPEIYGLDQISAAETYRATTLETSVLINDGAGHFRVSPLARYAQAAPGFGVISSDFDADGRPDVHLAQNFYTPQRETGRMSGGLSILLTNTDPTGLTPVSPRRSGLVIPEDAKGLSYADLDNDQRPDIVATTNDGPVRVFRNQGSDAKMLRLSLKGAPGNPVAIGARVSVSSEGAGTQTAEVYAGSGYLSQSSSDLFFGVADTAKPLTIQVNWPNGTISTQTAEPASGHLVLQQPPVGNP